MLSKALIQLSSADGWCYTPSLVVVWPEVTQPWGRVMNPKGIMPREIFQCPCPCGDPLQTHASTGGPPTLAGSFGSVSCGVTAPLFWVLVCAKFCVSPPRLVAQMVKCLPTMQEAWVQSLSREDPLEKEIATHSNILAWKIPWMEEPGRLQSMGLGRVRHD